MNTIIKLVFTAACVLLIVAVQPSDLWADDMLQSRIEADQYYQQGSYSRAFKAYLKLAKAGDYYSQDRVSQMYASGEGKKVNLTEAYAWSVLAAESGEEQWEKNSQALLQRVRDPAKAQKKAEKLVKKYGRKTQERKAAASANRDPSRCIGSLLACKRR